MGKAIEQEQRETVFMKTQEIYSLLEKTPPDGLKFVSGIKKMLEGEKRWSAWKNAGCPEHPRPASMKLNLSGIKEKRYLGDILKESIASNRSSMNNPPATVTLEDCKSKIRIFLPKLTDYLREAAEELAPESTVAEENKKICDGEFGWRAIRLMANRSNRFYDHKKDPIASKSEFLKMMILKVLDAERDTVQVSDVELLDEASGLSTTQVSISDAEYESLFGTLGDDWILLASKLGFTFSQIEFVEMSFPTPSQRASSILRTWFQGPTYPSIESFCTVMDEIGHSEISQLMKVRYLEAVKKKNVYQSQDTTCAEVDPTDVKKTAPELVDNSNVISDDDKPKKSVRPYYVTDKMQSEIESMMNDISFETITSPKTASFQIDKA